MAACQKLKDEGVAGNTAAMIRAVDNNGRPGYLKHIDAVVVSAVAKAEFDSGWELCKTVARRGVAVVAIS